MVTTKQMGLFQHPNINLIDSHCHLDYEYEGKTSEDLIREAKQNGVCTLITIGTEMASLPKLKAIAEGSSDVYFTVGVHPHEATTIQKTDIETLRMASMHPKCVAIGEIGLDYYYQHSPREAQIERLQWQLDLALERQLPVVIHSRDAEADLLPMLQKFAAQCSSIPGAIHCFTGTQGFGQACIDAGFYISFSGILTFKTAEDLRTSAKAFPLSRILVETDSPYLAPIPMRGKKCEPSMVRWTALKLSEIKGVTIDEVARTTTENAKKVFKLP